MEDTRVATCGKAHIYLIGIISVSVFLMLSFTAMYIAYTPRAR